MRYNTPVKAMLKKTITKISLFVISLSAVCFAGLSCSPVSSRMPKDESATADKFSTEYEKPRVVGEIKTKEIRESSGLAASRCNPGVFWTHNDSGDYPYLYALNAAGEKLGTWRVAGAKHEDWEDIAARRTETGECFLYIGDIGNNKLRRNSFTIYRVREPSVTAADRETNQKRPRISQTAAKIYFDYPGDRQDAETLMIHPQTGDIYILTKRMSSSSEVYKLSADYRLDRVNRLKKIAALIVPAVPNGMLTGGDIAPDGRRIILCDYFNAYELKLPEKAAGFEEIWRQPPLIVELGKRKQGEAVCYAADGRAILATSEKKDSPVIEVRRKAQ